ncbi:MAG: glycosyltransferase [Alphaproteobacteria bacterium]|nr:glycosyltransferase [Alphaproteobacteria bacterium]MBQ6888569.1 glycosyltransferase [Lachnospiraceae bacterium]
MKFSIITICYNEEMRIADTMKSIYSQSYTDFEHIIEDGCSTDNTLQLVKNCEKLYKNHSLRIFSQKDSGLYDAMNKAVARARGEYICFLNSGDYFLDENTLQRVSDYIDTYPEKEVYYGDAIVIMPNGNELFQTNALPEHMLMDDKTEILSTAGMGFIHQAMFAKNICFEKCSFNTKYRLRAELDWYYQCIDSGYQFKKMNYTLCKYSFGGVSEKTLSATQDIVETKKIITSHDYDVNKYEKTLMNSVSYLRAYNSIYKKWLALKVAGYSVEYFMRIHNVRTVAIYGYGELGNYLFYELKDSSVEVVCIIDKMDKYPYIEIPIIKPDNVEALQRVDMVIVTAVMHFEEIRNMYEGKGLCRIVSLEDVLEELWEIR